MEVLSLYKVIDNLEYVKTISDRMEASLYLTNLLPSIRISATALGYMYSFVLESIKLIIDTINNEECIIKYNDVKDAIDGVIKVLRHTTRDSQE